MNDKVIFYPVTAFDSRPGECPTHTPEPTMTDTTLTIHDATPSIGVRPQPATYPDGEPGSLHYAAGQRWAAHLPIWDVILPRLGLAGRTLGAGRHEYDPPGDATRFICFPQSLSSVAAHAAKFEGDSPEDRAKAELLRAGLAAGLTVCLEICRAEDDMNGRSYARVLTNDDGTRGAIVQNFRQRTWLTEEEAEGYAHAAAGGIPDVD